MAGVLAATTVDSPTNTEVFRTFTSEILAPVLRPGLVVVMDNLAAHKVAGIRETIEAAGCRLVYLPPYSPDFSPIEHIFSKVKHGLRTREARDVPQLLQAIEQSLASISAEDCLNCFASCGYTLHDK